MSSSKAKFVFRPNAKKSIEIIWFLSLHPKMDNKTVAKKLKSSPASIGWYRSNLKRGLIKAKMLKGKKSFYVIETL